MHQENQASLNEVAEVRELLMRTLQDLRSQRKPEVKRRLENKISDLKKERHTLKEEKNDFVADCNDLSTVFRTNDFPSARAAMWSR